MISFSCSEMRRLLRSGPAITRAIASSSSSMPITFLLARAARIAASLMRFARSAPLKPGVWRASTSRSTVESSGLLRAWTSRIWRRPLMSGRSRVTWRSNRPGRRGGGAGHAGFAGDCLAQQGLAGSRRTHKEDALRDTRAKGDELFGIFQKLDDLCQLLLGLVHPRHVGERDSRLVTGDHARPRAPERDGLVVAALRLAQHPPHEGRDEDHEDDVRQQHADQVAAGLALLELHGYPGGAQVVHVLALAGAVGKHDVVLVVRGVGDDAIRAADVDHGHVALGGLVQHPRVVPVALRLVALDRAPREPEDQAEDDDQCEVKQAGAGEAAQLRSPNFRALRAPGARGLVGFSSLTTFGAVGTCIGVIETWTPGSPWRLARSASTASPGTQASFSPAKTRGQASRSSRGTWASTKMSCSLREPRPPTGRRRSPGLRNPRWRARPARRCAAPRSSQPMHVFTCRRNGSPETRRDGTTCMRSPTIRKRRPPGRSTPRPPLPGSARLSMAAI